MSRLEPGPGEVGDLVAAQAGRLEHARRWRAPRPAPRRRPGRRAVPPAPPGEAGPPRPSRPGRGSGHRPRRVSRRRKRARARRPRRLATEARRAAVDQVHADVGDHPGHRPDGPLGPDSPRGAAPAARARAGSKDCTPMETRLTPASRQASSRARVADSGLASMVTSAPRGARAPAHAVHHRRDRLRRPARRRAAAHEEASTQLRPSKAGARPPHLLAPPPPRSGRPAAEAPWSPRSRSTGSGSCTTDSERRFQTEAAAPAGMLC